MIKNMKEGYTQTELGLIPVDWDAKLLKNVIKIGNGRDYKHLNEGEIPVLGTGGIITYVDDYLHEGKSIGIGRKGTIDNPMLLNGKFWTVDTLFYVKEFYNVDVDFLYNIFKSIKWKKHNEGTGLPSLSQSNILNIKIPLPPIEEQNAIANCLSTWDEAIEKQQKLIEAKEIRHKALMQKLLSGKKRLPGFTDEWKEVKLGDISVKKSSNLQANNLIENSGSYNVYGASGVATKIDSFTEDEGYIAIVKDGSGVGNLFLCEPQSSVLGTLDMIYPKDCNLIFLYNILQKIDYDKYKVGGAIPHIYYKSYSKEIVKLPSLEEQILIADILNNSLKEIEIEKKKVEQLKEQKKALMQKLLTGKVRLPLQN